MARCMCILLAVCCITQVASAQLSPGSNCRGGTKDVSDPKSVDIDIFYNNNNGRIDVNITTERLHHKCIEILHKPNEKFSENCESTYTYLYFAENSSSRTTVLPAGYASIHEELQPGCSYEVYVRGENEEYLKTEFSVPECVVPLCNCEYLRPNIEIQEIEQIGENRLHVTWKELNHSSNVTEIRAWVRSENGSKMLCGVTRRETASASLNCSGNFARENYTLFAGFSNSFDCKARTTKQFLGENAEVEVTTNILTVLKQMTDEDTETVSLHENLQRNNPASEKHSRISRSLDFSGVKNVTVHAVYNDVERIIQLNVTWMHFDENTDEFVPFRIKPRINDRTNSCDISYNYDVTLHLTEHDTTVMLPTLPTSESDKIEAGCLYEIFVNTYDIDNPSAAYEVPKCVGPICNYCSELTPQADLTSIRQLSPHRLNVTWMLDEPEYNVSQVEFKYRTTDTSYTPHVCDLFASTHDVNLRDEIYSGVECNGLVNGTVYTLIGKIVNNYNCTRVVRKDFTALWFDHQEESRGHLWIEIAAFVAIVILVTLTLYYKRKPLLEKFKLSNTRTESYEIYEAPAVGETRKAQECYNIIYCESEILDGNVDRYEIPRTRVKIIKLLDSGAFGQVFSARLLGTVDGKPLPLVAVKTLRDNAPPEELEDFLSEIDILKRIGEHPNVVKLVGCCTLKQPYMMVMELVPCGSLKTYLLKLRKRWESTKEVNDNVFLDSGDCDYIQPDSPASGASTIPSHKFPSLTETEYTNVESEGHTPLLTTFNYTLEPVLDHTELQNFALQIAKGMAYLEEKQITHRDLAARNILINEFKTLKISDFGLSRVGPYINSKTKKLPLRWMSIEAIEDLFYNNKSDVWSFGVVLWEIGSLGAIPYEHLPDALILHDLLMGKRLEKPAICTDDLYRLMLKCWAHDPNQRPTFAELVEQLDVQKTRIYVDFSQLNPTYVFPPATLQKMSNAQVVTQR